MKMNSMLLHCLLISVSFIGILKTTPIGISVEETETEKEMRVFSKYFQFFDNNQDGVISQSDFDYLMTGWADENSTELFEERFSADDLDSNGELSPQEFKVKMQAFMSGPQEIDMEDDEFDIDKNGQYSLDELEAMLDNVMVWYAEAMELMEQTDEEYLREFFTEIDTDNSNSASVVELYTALQPYYTENIQEDIKTLVANADTDKSTELEEEEFVEYMHSASVEYTAEQGGEAMTDEELWAYKGQQLQGIEMQMMYQSFNGMDDNGDNLLQEFELQKYLPNFQTYDGRTFSFADFDRNQNGEIDIQEFEKALRCPGCD